MLIPARTDTKVFHESIYNKTDVDIRFIRSRIVFVGAQWNAPFPSMLVIFHPYV
jgi:site-specific DNA-methyltransferase (adenine-specific)